MRAIGRDPIFIDRGERAELVDVDGNRFVDYVCSWGPLIHGHAHPDVLAAVTEAAARGTSFGAPTAAEVELAGAYHGHVDGLLAQAGSGLATQALPASPGVPAASTAATTVIPWNDAD